MEVWCLSLWQPEPPALLGASPRDLARARVAMECVRVSSVVSDRFLKVVPVIERPGAKGGGPTSERVPFGAMESFFDPVSCVRSPSWVLPPTIQALNPPPVV